jgi:hypothetical protein
LKKALPDINKDIPAHIAMLGNHLLQKLRTVNLPACPAVVQGLMGCKWTGHAKHRFPSGFLDKKRHAAGTAILFGPEPDDRRIREQCPWQRIVVKPC